MDHRPPVAQKPITASALALLEFYYRLKVFVIATEEKAPIEWAAKCILGVRKRGPTQSCARSTRHADLKAWLCHKVLMGMGSGRIGRGRETQPCALADAFFIALAGGESEARSCAQCLAGATRADLQAADSDDHDEAASEVRDYMVYSGLLWRLHPDGG